MSAFSDLFLQQIETIDVVLKIPQETEYTCKNLLRSLENFLRPEISISQSLVEAFLVLPPPLLI